jgi:17beta-estradiol 17-dehydrogenase / very-long-chain 3-oxoacyl-CoA reductase
MNSNTHFLLQWLGALIPLLAAFTVARWLWQYVCLPLQAQRTRLAQRYGAGSWALITGASDGLGKAFAQQLAGHGFNLVLVARTQSKLDRLQTELQTQGVQVRTVAADLSGTADSTYAPIAASVHDLDLSVLVNCVGSTVHRRYTDIPVASLRRLLAINVHTTATLTHTLLPALLRHHTVTGHRAALINVGSIVGRFYWPGTQLYGACKAFIDHLTVPLAFEYREQLDVLSFQPTVMSTAMATGTEPAVITITPDQAARAALSQVGHVVSSHGHWRHALLAVVCSVIPAGRRNLFFLAAALEMGESEKQKGE